MKLIGCGWPKERSSLVKKIWFIFERNHHFTYPFLISTTDANEGGYILFQTMSDVRNILVVPDNTSIYKLIY